MGHTLEVSLVVQTLLLKLLLELRDQRGLNGAS